VRETYLPIDKYKWQKPNKLEPVKIKSKSLANLDAEKYAFLL
jgi:hypothetical protein